MDAASPAGQSDFLTGAYAGIGAHDVLERDLAALVTGRQRARELLASTPTGTASRLEQVAFRVVRDALSDLPVTVLTNRMLGNYCYDLLIPEAKVAVEIDSFTFHAVGGAETTPQSFVKQVWKDNEATHLGWLVRHYTEFCIHRAGGYVTSDLHRCVVPRISRGPGVLPDAEEDAVFAWHPIYRKEPWRP
jgi:very-short-patch-repair endonuclease